MQEQFPDYGTDVNLLDTATIVVDDRPRLSPATHKPLS